MTSRFPALTLFPSCLFNILPDFTDDAPYGDTLPDLTDEGASYGDTFAVAVTSVFVAAAQAFGIFRLHPKCRIHGPMFVSVATKAGLFPNHSLEGKLRTRLPKRSPGGHDLVDFRKTVILFRTALTRYIKAA